MKTSYWKLAVAGAASVGLLTACSGNSGGGSGDSGGDGGGSGDGELSGEVEVWSWNVAAASLEQAAEQFMEEHPDVEITVQDSSTDDVYERLTVGLGSGGSGLPDVVSLESSQLENYKSQFPDGFMNLSENGFDVKADDKLPIIAGINFPTYNTNHSQERSAVVCENERGIFYDQGNERTGDVDLRYCP